MKLGLYHILAASALALGCSPAIAQTLEPPFDIDGFFTLRNEYTKQDLNAAGRYKFDLRTQTPEATGNLFRIQTDEAFSFAKEMERLQDLLNNGEITEAEYTAQFLNLMNVHSWKSGFYPVTRLEVQGVDYIEMISKLSGYAYAAKDYFINNEVDTIYDESYGTLLLLCVFASDVITPADIDSIDTFRAWVSKYLNQWIKIWDFNIYLSPVYYFNDLSDEDTECIYTGQYTFRITTPKYIGSMEKAQTYINSMREQDGDEPINFWESAKEYILDQIAKDYPVKSNAYRFALDLLDQTNANTPYMLGVDNLGLYLQQLPDAFNTQEITLTQEDIDKCTWYFDKVDSNNPVSLPASRMVADGNGLYATTYYSPFSFKMLDSGMKAYYAAEVDNNGTILAKTEISGDIPAFTPLIITSDSNSASSNRILPLDDAIESIDACLLEGVTFATDNDGFMRTLAAAGNNLAFTTCPVTVDANSAYFISDVSNVGTILTDDENSDIYDLFGRKLSGKPDKGIYIVNGKKVLKF